MNASPAPNVQCKEKKILKIIQDMIGAADNGDDWRAG